MRKRPITSEDFWYAIYFLFMFGLLALAIL